MKIAPVQNSPKNNVNFGAVSSISKYGDNLQNAIVKSIDKSFDNILPKISDNEKELGPIYDKITDGIASIIGTAANTGVSKKLVNTLNKFKKPSARMADLASFAITFFYVNNTRKSKKIEEERKMPLMVNNIAVTVVSSTMAALIDKFSDVALDRVKGALYNQKGTQALENTVNAIKNNANLAQEFKGHSVEELGKDILSSQEFIKNIREYSKRFEKTKSLTIFAITVRFLVTVLMVPVVGKLVKMIKEHINKDAQQVQSRQSAAKTDNDDDDDDD